MQLQLIFFENKTIIKTKIKRGDDVIINKMIAGKNGQEAKVKSIVEDSGEKKYLIQFLNGIEFWTNAPAVELKQHLIQ